jgi:trehalose-6-phosphate synthase
LFHYLLWQDVTSEIPVEDEGFSAYKQANQAYANAILAVLKPGDLIWIHDYHLLLAPRMIRTGAPDAHIGLFVHTPFPSSEVFRCLPRRKEILDGMLGANLVCFQVNLLLNRITTALTILYRHTRILGTLLLLAFGFVVMKLLHLVSMCMAH